MEDDASGDGRVVMITLAKKTMGHESWATLLESEKVDLTITNRVRQGLDTGTALLACCQNKQTNEQAAGKDSGRPT